MSIVQHRARHARPARSRILAGPDGAVRAAGFTADPATLLPLVHPACGRPLRQRADLGPVTAAVRVLSGRRPDRDRRGAGASSTPAASSWRTPGRCCARCKPGEPVTYTGFAALAGRPRGGARRRGRPAPATRPRCSSRATGCCAPTARSAATAGAWT